MSTIPAGPPPVPITVPTHAPIGKPAVGFESVAAKDRTLPPVENAAAAEHPEQHDVVVRLSGDGDDQRRRRHRDEPDSAEPAAPEQSMQPAAARRAPRFIDGEAFALPPGSLLDQTI